MIQKVKKNRDTFSDTVLGISVFESIFQDSKIGGFLLTFRIK